MARSNLYSNSMIKGYRYVCIKRVSDLSLLYELVVSICHLQSNNLNNNNNVNVSRSSDTGTIAGLWRRRLRINDKSDNGDNVNSSYRRYCLCWEKNRKRRSLCGDESQTSESNSLFWFQQKKKKLAFPVWAKLFHSYWQYEYGEGMCVSHIRAKPFHFILTLLPRTKLWYCNR